MKFFEKPAEKIVFAIAIVYCLVSSWVLYVALACGEYWSMASRVCRAFQHETIIIPFVPALEWFSIYFDFISWVNSFSRVFDNPIIAILGFALIVLVFAWLIVLVLRVLRYLWALLKKARTLLSKKE